MNAVENNKLYEGEQRSHLKKNYQAKRFKQLKGRKSDVMNMQLFSTFESNAFIELAIAALEKKGISKENIYAIPLDNRTERDSFYIFRLPFFGGIRSLIRFLSFILGSMPKIKLRILER